MPLGHLYVSDCFWLCISCSLCQKYTSSPSLNGWFIILDLAKMWFPLGRLPWLLFPLTAGLAFHYSSMISEPHTSITPCRYCCVPCPSSPLDSSLQAGTVHFISPSSVSCIIHGPWSLDQCFLHLKKLTKVTWSISGQADLHQIFSLQRTPLSLVELRT